MSSGVSWSALRASCRDTVSSVMPGCCFELCPSSVVPGCCFVPCSVLRVSCRALSFEHRAALPFERRAGLLLEFCSSSVMPGCCFELFFSKHQPACRTGMYRAACRGLPFDSVPGYYFERNAVVLLRALPFECNAVVLLRALPFECRAGLLLRPVLCPSSIVPRSALRASCRSALRASCRAAIRALPVECRAGMLLWAVLCPPSVVSGCCFELFFSKHQPACTVGRFRVACRVLPFERRAGMPLRA